MTIPDQNDDAVAANSHAVARPNGGSTGYAGRRALDVPRRSRVSQLGLDRRIGGRMGRHAWPRGIFFDPGPWAVMSAIVVWLLTIYRVTPCVQHVASKTVDPYQRQCYSDIPTIYRSSGMGHGGSLFSNPDVAQTPLVTVLMAFCRRVVWVFGAEVSPKATDQQVLDAANAYWGVAQVVLFVAFLAVVISVMLLGRSSDTDLPVDEEGRPTQARRRSWDAFWVVLCPAVYLAGLIDFSMVPVALATTSMLAWSRRRPWLAGILIGLACAGSLQAAVVAFAVLVCCLRATRLPELGRYLLSGFLALVACHVIACCLSLTTWWTYLRSAFWSGTGLGTMWYVIQDSSGGTIPGIGWITGTLTIGGLLGLAWLSMTVPRRPRIAQVACMALLILFITNKVYSPQWVLLLVPLAALARPDFRDWAVLMVGECFYSLAVWAHLGGLSLPGGSDADIVYWASIVLRLACEIWFAWGVVDDIRRPWNDVVRVGYADDPTGGVLDHAPDPAPEGEPAAEAAR